MKAKTPIVHNIAFLSDLAVTQDGEFVKVSNTLDANLRALDTAVQNAGSQIDYTVTVTESTPEGYAKAYTLTQNNTTIGTINIPKDMVVQSGSVVDKQEAGAWGPAGKYIELTLANSAGSKVWIAVADLVDTYTVQQNAAEVQLAIDANREISASIVAGSIAKGKLDSGVQASLDKADTALQPSALDPYATTQAVNQALDGKADKDSDAVEGNLAVFDANGNPVDSGKAASDFAEADHTHDSLVNGNASLNLSQAGAATVTIEGAGPATTATGVVTLTAGTLSGTGPNGQFSYEVEAQTINVPLTLANSSWSGSSEAEVGELAANVIRPTDTQSYGTVFIGKKGSTPAPGPMPSMEFISYSIVGDYDNPTLELQPLGTTFTGTVTYSQVAGPAASVTKTLATTDDVQTAINALDAEVTSSDGTNVQVKVTETNGKVTAVNITTDNTYAKPEGGIPGTDIADGAITTGKLSELNYFIFNDLATSGDNVGKKWKLSVLDGRLQIEGVEDGDAPYVPQGYPAYIAMDQIASGAMAPKDAIHYLWRIYIDDQEGYVCYKAATGSPAVGGNSGYPSDDMNTLWPLDNDHDYVELPWHINWMGNFSGRPTLVCEEGCPFTADMFELSWVDPEDVDQSLFPEESGAAAPRKRLAKRK